MDENTLFGQRPLDHCYHTNGTDDTSDDKSASCDVTVNPVTFEVTYRVKGGTWSDGSTTEKKETVQSGSKPASVPTGMKASEGYTGGAWDTDPANATITGATTFTYTFTSKTAATVTKAPKAKTLTANGQAQELVTAGEAKNGTMQYAPGTKDAATGSYSTTIPKATDAGTYNVWYKAKGNDGYTDSEATYVEAKINAPEPGKSSIKNDSTLPEAEKEFSLTVKAGEEPGPEPGPKPEPGPGPEPSAEIQTDSTLPEAKPDEEFDSCIIKIY